MDARLELGGDGLAVDRRGPQEAELAVQHGPAGTYLLDVPGLGREPDREHQRLTGGTGGRRGGRHAQGQGRDQRGETHESHGAAT